MKTVINHSILIIINTLVIDRNQLKTIDNEKEQKEFAKSVFG